MPDGPLLRANGGDGLDDELRRVLTMIEGSYRGGDVVVLPGMYNRSLDVLFAEGYATPTELAPGIVGATITAAGIATLKGEEADGAS